MKKIIVGVLTLTILLLALTGCTEPVAPAVCGNNMVESGESCDNTECPIGNTCENCNCQPLPQPPALPEE